jgi:predicted amidohydrolase
MAAFKMTTATFDPHGAGLTVGLANIQASVPDVAANQALIREALAAFRREGVNLAIFPEFALTGTFWEDDATCRSYMLGATLEHQRRFIDHTVRPALDDTLRLVVLNVLRRADPPHGNRFFNSTLVIGRSLAGRPVEASYDKSVPAGIEKRHLTGGGGRRLVLETTWGRLGFLTCYDLCFPSLLLGYHLVDRVDAVILTAAWRGPAPRRYSGLGIDENDYYGRLWELLIPAQAAAAQAWFFAANAVGSHAISGATFWGGSGVWAPSGLPLLRAAHDMEELLVLRHIPLVDESRRERADFDYRADHASAGLAQPALPAAHVVDCR